MQEFRTAKFSDKTDIWKHFMPWGVTVACLEAEETGQRSGVTGEDLGTGDGHPVMKIETFIATKDWDDPFVWNHEFIHALCFAQFPQQTMAADKEWLEGVALAFEQMLTPRQKHGMAWERWKAFSSTEKWVAFDITIQFLQSGHNLTPMDALTEIMRG